MVCNWLKFQSKWLYIQLMPRDAKRIQEAIYLMRTWRVMIIIIASITIFALLLLLLLRFFCSSLSLSLFLYDGFRLARKSRRNCTRKAASVRKNREHTFSHFCIEFTIGKQIINVVVRREFHTAIKFWGKRGKKLLPLDTWAKCTPGAGTSENHRHQRNNRQIEPNSDCNRIKLH